VGIGGAARDGVDGAVETGLGGGATWVGLLGRLGGRGTFLDCESDCRAGIGGGVAVLVELPPAAWGARRDIAGGAVAGAVEDTGGTVRLGSVGGPGEGVVDTIRLGIGGGPRAGDEAGIGGGGVRPGRVGGGLAGRDGAAAASAGGGMVLFGADTARGTGRLGATIAGDASLFGIAGGFAKDVEMLAWNVLISR
jgi:hypothetical protein